MATSPVAGSEMNVATGGRHEREQKAWCFDRPAGLPLIKQKESTFATYSTLMADAAAKGWGRRARSQRSQGRVDNQTGFGHWYRLSSALILYEESSSPELFFRARTASRTVYYHFVYRGVLARTSRRSLWDVC